MKVSHYYDEFTSRAIIIGFSQKIFVSLKQGKIWWYPQLIRLIIDITYFEEEMREVIVATISVICTKLALAVVSYKIFLRKLMGSNLYGNSQNSWLCHMWG